VAAIPAHVVRNMAVISSRDVVFGKAARYRVSLCRDVIDTEVVRAPAHVAKSTDMPGAHIAEASDVSHAANVATETTDMAAQAADVAAQTADVS
jgi:hypothetical protein